MTNPARRFLLLLGCTALPFMFPGCRSSTPSRLEETLAAVKPSMPTLPAEPFRDILTVQAAIERACASSGEIATLAATVEVAEQQYLAAHNWNDPELRLAYGEDSGETTRRQFSTLSGPPAASSVFSGQSVGTIADESTHYDVALRLSPPNPWAQDQTASAGEADAFAAVAELSAAQWRLANNVRRRFAEIDHLDADFRLLSQLTALYSNAVETINARAEQGESTLENLLTASRRYLGAVAEKDKSVRQRNQARRNLASLVAVPSEDLLIRVDANSFSEPALKDATRQALKSKALENRQDLAALHWQTQAAHARHLKTRIERWPWFTFVDLSYGSGDSTSDRHFTSTGATALEPTETASATDSGSDDAWQIATGIQLPLFSGTSHSEAVALAEYRRAVLMEERAIARAEREIDEGLGALRTLTSSRDALQREADPILRQMQEGLERLQSTIGLAPEEVVRIREQILEAQRLQLAFVLEYRLAVIDLEEVLGMELDQP